VDIMNRFINKSLSLANSQSMTSILSLDFIRFVLKYVIEFLWRLDFVR